MERERVREPLSEEAALAALTTWLRLRGIHELVGDVLSERRDGYWRFETDEPAGSYNVYDDGGVMDADDPY